MVFKDINYDKVELDKVEVIHSEDGKYFLHVAYILENDNGIYKLDFPRVDLPIRERHFITGESWGFPTIDLGIGDRRLYRSPETKKEYTIETLEEKVHKLTLAEIEERLGYKIEIVRGE